MITFCKPMKRDKLRRILACELFKKDMEKAKTNIANHPLRIDITQEFLDETAYRQYLAEYYPGKYRPYEETD